MENYEKLIEEFIKLKEYYTALDFTVLAKHFQDAAEALQELVNQLKNK